MIYDSHGASLPDDPVLKELEGWPTGFHLTGSYYFRCSRPDSDIDLMAEYYSGIAQALEHAGFVQRGDDKIAEAYLAEAGGASFLGTIVLMEKGKVQIQLVTDLMAKCWARDTIRKYHSVWHEFATKEERTVLWHGYLKIHQAASRELRELLGLPVKHLPFDNLSPADQL